MIAPPFKRYLPLITIAILMITAYSLGIEKFLTFEKLREQRQQLQQLVANYPVGAPLLYILIYTTATALSVPGALFLTLAGGFLFSQPWATVYVVTGATTGAILIFLAAKTALGDMMKQKAGGLIEKVVQGFQDNVVSYLLFLRLVPVFPFWLVNLAPAFAGVSLRTFAWTTFLGIMPGSFVFCQAGTGLGAIFDSGKEFSIDTIFNRDVKIAFVALGIFALLPIVVKKIRKNKYLT